MVLVPRNLKIVMPAVINLVLGLLVYVIMWFRTDKSRTFHFVAVIDVVIVAIWISSLVEFGAMMRNDRTGTISTLDAVFLGMLPIGIAMIVRLLDIGGNRRKTLRWERYQQGLAAREALARDASSTMAIYSG
ncbi:hypothetical protein HYQ46_008862 [Verticillium longisporum]|nr:hypothetical protein HYQ46_008862 [Verticillium longisporum]